MKCVISGVHIKVFARAIHSLARIGDELYIEPSGEGISFSTVNSSRSAFASFIFGRDFFSQCESVVDGAAASTSQAISSSQSNPDSTKCKVAMRAFLGAFKSLSSVEKTVERCKIVVDDAAAKVVVQLVCRYSVTRNYHLPFIECETLRAVYDESSCPYSLTSQSRLLSDVAVNFQPGQDEVSLKVTPSSASVRNYVDDEPDLSKVIRTELKLESDEFDAYDIPTEGEVVFNLKELRAILGFSEPCNLPVTTCFSQPGSPMIFSVDNKPLFESKFVLATLASPQSREFLEEVPSAAAAHASVSGRNSAQKQAPPILESSEQHVEEHHQEEARDESILARHSATKKPNILVRQLTEHTMDGDMDDTDNDDIPLVTRRKDPLHLTTKNATSWRANTAVIEDHDFQRSSNSFPKRPSSPANDSRSRPLDSNGKEAKDRRFCTQVEDPLQSPRGFNINNIEEVGLQFQLTDRESPGNNIILSPPPKKKRKHFLFYRCFNSTYDAHNLTSTADVLAPDSDPED